VWSSSYWDVFGFWVEGRIYCDDVAEILSCGKTTVNDMFKVFVKNYSEAFYAIHIYVPEGEELDQVEADYAK
jgi:hypothetical protein